jgi:enhancing lycopene biosynthesis protein 2
VTTTTTTTGTPRSTAGRGLVSDRATRYDDAVDRVTSTPTLGLLLSGAGARDGADPRETTLLLLALAQLGVAVRAYAPDVRAAPVDHIDGQTPGPERNARREAARLVPDVADLAGVQGTDHEGWLLPGGGGALRVLSDFTAAQAQGRAPVIHADVGRVLREAFAARIAVGACGDAALLVALVARNSSRRLRLTLGARTAEESADHARLLDGMGHVHVPVVGAAAAADLAIDGERKVVTGPGLACGAGLDVVAVGLHRLARQVVDWSREELSAPRNLPR